MKLDNFVEDARLEAEAMSCMWRVMNKMNPEKFPLEMPKGLWYDRLAEAANGVLDIE